MGISATRLIYESCPTTNCSTMERIYRATLLALYQMTLIVGILMMPLALATQKVGVRLPIDKAVLGLKEAYEHA